tara:strand:- start:663 stop:896 length:234 start_codon:yes stop_codon:yes gene_type:complete
MKKSNEWYVVSGPVIVSQGDDEIEIPKGKFVVVADYRDLNPNLPTMESREFGSYDEAELEALRRKAEYEKEIRENSS